VAIAPNSKASSIKSCVGHEQENPPDEALQRRSRQWVSISKQTQPAKRLGLMASGVTVLPPAFVAFHVPIERLHIGRPDTSPSCPDRRSDARVGGQAVAAHTPDQRRRRPHWIPRLPATDATEPQSGSQDASDNPCREKDYGAQNGDGLQATIKPLPTHWRLDDSRDDPETPQPSWSKPTKGKLSRRIAVGDCFLAPEFDSQYESTECRRKRIPTDVL
jgi:hypothetical protein